MLSSYEKIRAQNIERNNARLRALGLISVNEEAQSNALAWREKRTAIKEEEQGTSKTSPNDNKSKSKKRKCPEASPTRKSLRLQSKHPDGVERVVVVDKTTTDDDDDSHNESLKQERQARIQECREVRLRRAVEVSEQGAAQAARENPTASYEHCLMRVRTMTEKGLSNRVKSIERAAGKHSVIKMAIFKSCLQDQGLWDLAEIASKALERLKALKAPIEDE
jgi:RNA-binding protein YhbY